LQLGDNWLTLETLPIYADQLQSWSQVLTEDADILLYGCNVAQGDRGQTFVQQLSQLTHADIAASDDLTGNAALGGDWNLEVTVGTVIAPSAFHLDTLHRYNFVLPIERVSVSISEDGRYAVFYSNGYIQATGLPDSGLPGVYVYDRQTSITTRIADGTVEAPGNTTNSVLVLTGFEFVREAA
jgi:hypothetical protein